MLIYHKTKDEIHCTAVQYFSGNSVVTHSSYVWEKHKEAVETLENDGEVYVTGGNYLGAVYEGKFEPRDMFERYMSREV